MLLVGYLTEILLAAFIHERPSFPKIPIAQMINCVTRVIWSTIYSRNGNRRRNGKNWRFKPNLCPNCFPNAVQGSIPTAEQKRAAMHQPAPDPRPYKRMHKLNTSSFCRSSKKKKNDLMNICNLRLTPFWFFHRFVSPQHQETCHIEAHRKFSADYQRHKFSHKGHQAKPKE